MANQRFPHTIRIGTYRRRRRVTFFSAELIVRKTTSSPDSKNTQPPDDDTHLSYKSAITTGPREFNGKADSNYKFSKNLFYPFTPPPCHSYLLRPKYHCYPHGGADLVIKSLESRLYIYTHAHVYNVKTNHRIRRFIFTIYKYIFNQSSIERFS